MAQTIDASAKEHPFPAYSTPIITWRALPLVLFPVTALLIAILTNGFVLLDYVHVMTGSLWTGIDIFMGLVIGPIIARMPAPARADFVRKLVPTMLFLMPTIASVAITSGMYLATREGLFNLNYTAIQLSGLFIIILSAQGFGIFLPNEVRIVMEQRKALPDVVKIGRLGLLNARLAGVQALFQIVLIFVMANLAGGIVNI